MRQLLMAVMVMVMVMVLVAAACGDGDDGAVDANPSVQATPTPEQPPTVPATPTPEPSPTPEPAATSTPEPTTAPLLPTAGWEAVDNGTHLWANEIIVAGDEFFALGSESGPEVAVPRAGVWRSTDGVSWSDSLIFSRVSHPDVVLDLADIVIDDDEIVVVARRSEQPDWAFAEERDLVMFGSGDGGKSWSETVIQHWDGANFRDWSEGVSFADGDPGVMYAVEGSSDVEDTGIRGTLLWVRTDDGWTYVDPADSGLEQVWAWAIAATTDGFVAIADVRAPGAEGFEDCQTQALWESVDAVTWTMVWQNPTDCEWFSINKVLRIDGELYALGNENDVSECTIGDDGSLDCLPAEPAVRLFHITDEAIEDVAVEPFEFTQMFLADVTVTDDTYVAIGKTFDESEARIWVSADTRIWAPADIPNEELADILPFQAAAIDGTIIALAAEIDRAKGPTNFHTWLTTG